MPENSLPQAPQLQQQFPKSQDNTIFYVIGAIFAAIVILLFLQGGQDLNPLLGYLIVGAVAVGIIYILLARSKKVWNLDELAKFVADREFEKTGLLLPLKTSNKERSSYSRPYVGRQYPAGSNCWLIHWAKFGLVYRVEDVSGQLILRESLSMEIPEYIKFQEKSEVSKRNEFLVKKALENEFGEESV